MELTARPLDLEPSERFNTALEESLRTFEVAGRRIGYVHVWTFFDNYDGRVLRVLAVGRLREVDALVLDLRDGWGGRFRQEFVDLFDATSPPRMTTTFRGRNLERISDFTWRRPVILLVNEGTKSANEMFAYAMHKYRHGVLVGSRTAGSVRSGSNSVLCDRGLLIVAVSQVLLDGEDIEGLGVTPGVSVESPGPYSAGADPQLASAIELLADPRFDGSKASLDTLAGR